MEPKTQLGKKSTLILSTLAITVTVIAVFYFRPTKIAEEIIQPRKSPSQFLAITNTTSTTPLSNSSISNLKSSILLTVPFTPQAPTANWDQLHNEACEEAVAIMTDAYFNHKDYPTLIPATTVEEEITALTHWQDERFGYHLDTTSAETAEMIEQVYRLHTKLIENFTEDDIKRELNQNHLVIISENGRLLGNPNYKHPGPLHHMLLIKGYTATEIITNDSGTRKGLDYPYDFSTILTAAADWDHAAKNVDTSIKTAIVVWK